jgi:hypothetical protein
MTFLLFFAWYYIIRKHFKIEKISPKERFTDGDGHPS